MAWHRKVRSGLILLLFSFVVISETMARGDTVISTSQANAEEKDRKAGKKKLEKLEGGFSGEPTYDTAYACEGKTLKIDCGDGELIKLIRANYGRFSITICNDHGNTDWSVNCMSPKSLRVLHSRCSHNQNCSIPASTSMFGDPCPGTHKYLEAHYQCLPATTTTTTNRPSPPWLITSQPPMWSTVKPSARPPPPPPKVTTSSTTASTTTSSTTSTSHLEPVEVDEEPPDDTMLSGPNGEDRFKIPVEDITPSVPNKMNSESTMANVPSPSALPGSWPKDFDMVDHCSPKTVRNIYWNWTRASGTNIQPCPGGTTGFAKWKCIKTETAVRWFPQAPDLSACRSVWLTSLENRILAGRDPLVTITNDLAQVTSSKTLYGGDMMITTKIIKTMTRKMATDIQTFPDTRQREAIVTEMLNDVVKTSSNLLDSSQHPSWRDLSYEEQMRVATSLLIGLEENAFLLADTVTREKTVNQAVKNIVLSVRVLETKSVLSTKFPSDGQLGVSNDTIELSQGALLDNNDDGFVRLVFVAFDRLEEILQWHPDASDKNVTRMLNSKVICASLGQGRHIQLKEPVRLTFQHMQTENVTNPSCVFWDYSVNTWSKEGCHVDATNKTHTVCLCNHLTNFALLMDVHAILLPLPHEVALRVITYIGCGVSIFCLILAVITFQTFKSLKSDRTTIHSNLCTCLLLAEIVFLAGIGQTENQIVCGVIAGFLQYLFLCAFAWMFFEGFQLYVMLIEVFEAEQSRIKWYYIFAYGIPLLIVLISGSVYPQGYGTDNFCWLKTDRYFIYSFVGPVILVLVLNLIFLALAIVMMCKHASTSASLKNKEHSRLATTRVWLRGAVILVFLLGLTWTFGFLYLNEESVAVAYVFCVLNSLQGFFIFLFHCVQNEKVRKEYRRFIRRQSWLPKCLRCSKPATGAASSSASSNMGVKERRTSLYAGSNGNPSGSNSHSTDNSVLSPHGTSLHRDWNSRSLTNINRMAKASAPPISTSANMAATLCRPLRGAGPMIPDPSSTLPYIRNIYKSSPKSVSTWGPLHNSIHGGKNISFKSYSRDSGHGGSEQEESPRAHVILNAKDVNRQFVNHESQYDYRHDSIPHPKHLVLPQSLQMHSTAGRSKKNVSKNHWNHHTYQEIYEGRMPRNMEEDPVYEEIERNNEIQVSDLSDEDGKRQSDMSRQSSRSYGDHRPLIPYSPGADRSILEALKYNANVEYRMRTRGESARSLAAVLDGETVVCHLEPPEMYPTREQYVSRTLVLPPSYSES